MNRTAQSTCTRTRAANSTHVHAVPSLACQLRRGRRHARGVSAAAGPVHTPPLVPAVTVDNIRDYDGQFGTKRKQEAERAPSPPTPSYEALLAELTPEEARVVQLFRDNSQSVVNVSTTINTVNILNPFNVQQVPRGVGSGFVWDTKGNVITNAHVISGASEVNITFADGLTAKAKVIGKDREKDIAVLQLQGLSPAQLAAMRPVQLGSSSNLLVGQRVYAIGNPFGLDQALSQGIVSGLGREVGGASFSGGPMITNGIQTDAAINPGNSGGPLLDSKGRVVGINTAILDPTGVGISSGVGFAIPIDAVQGMVTQILTLGRIVRPAMGISIAPVPLQMLKRLGGEVDDSAATNGSAARGRTASGGGVLVVAVTPGSPADAADVTPTKREMFGAVRLGDIITAINGKPVRSQKDLFSILDSHRVGDAVQVTLFSPATRMKRTVRIVLADREKLAGSAE